MSAIYNYLRDGGMILRIKPTVINCNTLKVFPTFDVGLKHLLIVVNGTGTGMYNENELIQIIASAVNGFYFDHWDDPSAVVTNVNEGTTTVIMPFLDCIVTATFLPYRTLTVNGGSGSSNVLKPNDVRQIVANAPAQNYVFSAWSGDTAYLNANTSPANVTMPDQNIMLTANYVIAYTGINYGRLYNYYAADDARNIANSGWHLPTYSGNPSDSMNLYNYLSTNGGGKLKEIGTVHWLTPNTGATNELGFNSRGAGIRAYSNGIFSDLKSSCNFWTFGTLGGVNYVFRLRYLETALGYFNPSINSVLLRAGASIRVMKDATTLSNGQPGTYIGNDGKVYATICIGTQEWVSSNLTETKYRDGSIIPTVIDNTAWGLLTTGAKCAYDNLESNV